ncbi:MAG: hypothetical protein ABGY95_07765 [Rubritalea sp.]|uniref:DUF883 family protein n=1 Tax=Rubritalea sp. TaxID=2109375 RepID=UPI0032424904
MDYATPNTNSLKDEEDATAPATASTIASKTADLRQAATEKARTAALGMQNRASQIKQAAGERAQQFRTYAGEKASALREDAGNRATIVKQAATEKYEQSKAKAKDVHATSEDYVRQHPTKCVLGAFGVGLLIGLLARRR